MSHGRIAIRPSLGEENPRRATSMWSSALLDATLQPALGCQRLPKRPRGTGGQSPIDHQHLAGDGAEAMLLDLRPQPPQQWPGLGPDRKTVNRRWNRVIAERYNLTRPFVK